MNSVLRAALLMAGASLLLGGDCMFGRPIVDDRGRYYPSDGVISCTGTLCADLPAYDLELTPPREDSPCEQDLPVTNLDAAVGTALVGVRYDLASEQEREVHLGALDLRDACLVISGPVRLNFGAGSKLTNVTLLLGPSAEPSSDRAQGARATPTLHFAHSELDRVVLQAAEQDAPSGSAQWSTALATSARPASMRSP